ncbi:HpcH/HpaI aldolase/citrate lyase family protein [Pseudobacillus wudalianchiensis]|uniref:Citrate lyase subunit beta n=1 Tax=Pseudobacillus wudalianchiensis TaxID=1743143 RepID=A0A1B9AXZ1_9BACI|nr:HpcH/HpaI aldolase/citrate lyase family protein [Bacillus wudalianchiensis]OCA88749.1 citrate lyase subunit beta [Bacillus wudalianchiensis]
MKYFNHLPELHLEGFFHQKPKVINKYTDRSKLAYSLGPLLYMPATRPDIAQLIMTNKYKELVALVICLEDAVGDLEVKQAEELLISHMAKVTKAVMAGQLINETTPLIFIRVRSAQQMSEIAVRLGSSLEQVAGFVFPKFSSVNGEGFLSELQKINVQSGTLLYGMPILESPEVLYKEKRMAELLRIKEIVDRYEELILNIRIGATDLCGLYGLRRNSQTTVYEISIVNELITDIVNLFSREPGGYVVSGPVWEHFSSNQRILKPQLRETPFEKQFGSEGLRLRKELISKNFDGLIQETLLDKANGLVGKTIIHPSHLLPVQAMHVVSKEEYVDALSIVQQANGQKGVFKSEFQNKMNEIKPHLKWAEKTLMKSDIYGVFHENSTFIDLLSEPVFS